MTEEKKHGPMGNSETILFVDDEELMTEIGEKILSKHGYNVITASDGESALKLYRDKKEKIDLIILNIVMPGMGNIQCLEELICFDSQAKIIMTSGYFLGSRADELYKTGAKSFVSKPFTANQILNVVRDVLDKARITGMSNGNSKVES